MIQAYWQNLMPRERRVLIAGAVALVLMLFYVLAWAPFQSERASREQAIEQQRELLGWMQGAAAELQALRTGGAGGSGAAAANRSVPLLTLVDGSARKQGLGGALKRVQPDGDAGVRVWLEGVDFDALLLWLDTLERSQGVLVKALVVEPQSPGRVKARLSLERP